METAPTSIEVLLRPTLGQSDEPSDLRGSLTPHLAVPGGHPSTFEPGATLLNFSDQGDRATNTDELPPYSESNETTYYLLGHFYIANFKKSKMATDEILDIV